VRANRKSPLVGLVNAGPVGKASIFRLGSIQAHLGPVLGPNPRVGTRIVNQLGAGQPAGGAADLNRCDLIVISARAARLPGILAELDNASIRWTGKVVVLYDCGKDSRALRSLADQGASTASIARLALDEPWFVVEGDRLAVRLSRRLLDEARLPVIVVDPSAHPLLSAAGMLAGALSMPLLRASEACLRHAGVDAARGGSLALAMSREALRAYRKAGRRAWTAALAASQEDSLAEVHKALDSFDPRLEQFFRVVMGAARRLMAEETRAWAANSTAS